MEEPGSPQAVGDDRITGPGAPIALTQLRLRLFDPRNPPESKPPFKVCQELSNSQGRVRQRASIKIHKRQTLQRGEQMAPVGVSLRKRWFYLRQGGIMLVCFIDNFENIILSVSGRNASPAI